MNHRMRSTTTKEEELALFLEMRKREKELNNNNNIIINYNNINSLQSLHDSEEFDAPLGAMPGTSPIFNLSSQTTMIGTMAAVPRKNVADDFLNSENDKNDYDWLLTPPGTPLFPSLEMESQKTVMSQIGTPKPRPSALKSRLANSQPEPGVRSNLAPKQATSSPGLNSSSLGMQRPSSSGGRGSRPATPTSRPTLPATSKPLRSTTPTSRSTLTSARSTVSSTRPTISAPKPSLSATKSTLSLTKPINSTTKPTSRSTTPLSRARSSTPTSSRASIPAAPKPTTSRAPTPTRRPTTSVTPAKLSAPVSRPVSTSTRNPVLSSAPSRVTSSAPSRVTSSAPSRVTSSVPSRGTSPAPSRGTSPTPKPRTWKPSDMPGFSNDAPPNLRTTLPDRPLSATRGRPGAPSPRSSSVEPSASSNGRPRRQSCSPSRGRIPNGSLRTAGGSVPAVNRAFSKANDNVSPGLMGTQMVERVINMRKLAPPKYDDKQSPRSNLSGKSSSPDSTGFGRTLSKKSLDMAIRHMDIRRTIPSNLRPLMTNIPASSMYSVRSGPVRSRTISVSDSPLATSSNASSEMSVNNNGVFLEVEDDNGSERGNRSPTSVRAR